MGYIGISTRRVNVGDRYVLEEIKKGGYNFGGEQSGHIVLSDYSTTGDGLVAALQVLSLLVSQEKKVSELFNLYKPAPQILKNLKLTSSSNPLEIKEVQDFISEKQKLLGQKGRILVRKSGTENLVRVMAEGEDIATIEKIVDEIIAKLSA